MNLEKAKDAGITIRRVATLKLPLVNLAQVVILGTCLIVGVFLFGIRGEGEYDTDDLKNLSRLLYGSIGGGWFIAAML